MSHPLIEKAREFEDIVEETRKLDIIEAESNSIIEAVLENGKIDDAAEQNKLSSARLRLDLIPSRRKKLQELKVSLLGELWRGYETERRAWNERVAAYRERRIQHAAAKLSDEFGGNERHARRQVERMQLPVLNDIRKMGVADIGVAPSELSAAALVSTIRSNVLKMQRLAPKLAVPPQL